LELQSGRICYIYGEYLASNYKFKGKNLEINFFSLEDAEKVEPKDTMALISMLDQGIKNEIRFNKWKHFLILNFDDVKSAEDGMVFSSHMADKLIDFALSLPKETKYIAIHCFAGISRSGAVTKFLTKYVFPECYNSKFDMEYSNFNRLVYDKLCSAWNKRKT
jgi:predicted protein tyrosine phosphatase